MNRRAGEHFPLEQPTMQSYQALKGGIWRKKWIEYLSPTPSILSNELLLKSIISPFFPYFILCFLYFISPQVDESEMCWKWQEQLASIFSNNFSPPNMKSIKKGFCKFSFWLKWQEDNDLNVQWLLVVLEVRSSM